MQNIYLLVTSSNNNHTDSKLEIEEATICELFTVPLTNTGLIILRALTAHQPETLKVIQN
jgi:hypothetical protein